MQNPTPQLFHKGQPDQLLRDTEASALLGIGRSTFHRWVAEGSFPKPVKMGGCTRWWKSEIEGRVASLSKNRDAACA
jgi:predicted DNA-binding transcriptional regulator AlpA